MQVTFEMVYSNASIRTYIQRGNDILGVMGYTEHSFVHAGKVAQRAQDVLTAVGATEREVELAKIAGFMHDIGNVVNRVDHAHTGGIMAFQVLNGLGMPPDEIATVISAIGHHDEGSGGSVNKVAAALILADKTDVRRSRVRSTNYTQFDIHDRVNFAVEESNLVPCPKEKTILLEMKIDTKICPVMDYFEIFLSRMMMCRRAAEFLDMQFLLNINGASMI